MPREKTSLNIVSVNVGRFLEERPREFIRRLGNDILLPDVLVVQDVPFRECPSFEQFPFVTFAPMTNHFVNGERAVVGIAIFSRYFMTNIRHFITWGNGLLKDLEGVDEHNQRYLGEESDRLVEATEDRMLICARVQKDGVDFDIATTHGMWARGGIANNIQRSSTRKLRNHLELEAILRDSLVVAGDLNAARDSEIYNSLTQKMSDCLPRTVESTLDPDHPLSKRGINVVIDYVMLVPNGARKPLYQISDVRLYSGVSDHQAIFATITKEEQP